jgi:uncharacterized membrane protein YfcA
MGLFVTIAIAACIASLLSFFSGFGLGTILTPVFAVFFPVEVAIALTGIVHLLNNLFKFSLTAKSVNVAVLLKFGLPSMLGAFGGALLLKQIDEATPIYMYEIGNYPCNITLLKLLVAVLMIVFTLLEVIPYFKNLQADNNKLFGGGLLSGFFGGLSGHQGALRSIFLVRSGLSKNAFIATGVAIACLVDLIRLPIYFSGKGSAVMSENLNILLVALGASFIGAFAGNILLKKVTIELVQKMVMVMILLLAMALGAGII